MMKNSVVKYLGFVLFFSIILGCGTRDYGTEKDKADTKNDLEVIIGKSKAKDLLSEKKLQKRINETQGISTFGAESPDAGSSSKEGYIWEGMRFISIPEDKIASLQERLQNEKDLNNACMVGTVLASGVVLAFVIRIGGSIFFGAHPEYNPGTHWFWQGLGKTKHLITDTSFRGAAFATGCHLALVGVGAIGYKGLMGPEYSALSASVLAGSMVAWSSSPYLNYFSKSDWGQPTGRIGKWLQTKGNIGQWAGKAQTWTSGSVLGRGLRYEIIPGLILLGIASGVGVVVYDGLQEYCSGEENSSTGQPVVSEK